MEGSLSEAVRRGFPVPRIAVVAATTVLVGAALAGAFELRDRAYRDRPLPGVRVLSPSLAESVDLSVNGRLVRVLPAGLLRLDVTATNRAALAAGRGSLASRVVNLLSPVPVHRDVRPALALRPGPVRGLNRELASLSRPPVSARISLRGLTPVVVPGHAGSSVDHWRLLSDLKRRAIDGGRGPIVVHFVPKRPPLSTATAREAAAAARMMLSHAITLTYGGTTRGALQPNKLAQLLRFRVLGNQYVARFDPASTARAAHAAVRSFAKPARDATFAVNGDHVSVVQSRNGFDVDSKATVAAVTAAASTDAARSAEVAMGPALPSLTTRQARALGITTKLVSFTTEMGASSSNRIHNVHLMANFIDGTVIPPGKSFSYNDVVGPRTAERGFLEGQMIVGSLVLPAIGGGVCQTATTLFNDAFELGLPILERHNHNLYLSHYPRGRDATVSWGGPDLKFRNDYKHGLLIKSSYTDSTLTFTFYGTSEGRRITSTTSGATKFRASKMSYALDPSAPARSVTVVSGSGAQGFDLTVKRTVYDRTGKVIRRDTFNSRYVPDGPTTVYGPGRTPPGPYIVIPRH
jgi:vancomycin resistance protein YoaR